MSVAISVGKKAMSASLLKVFASFVLVMVSIAYVRLIDTHNAIMSILMFAPLLHFSLLWVWGLYICLELVYT